MDLQKVFQEAQKLNRNIECLLKFSKFESYGDLHGLHVDYEDSNELFLAEEIQKIIVELTGINDKLKYLSCPVKEISRLYKNHNGRYETSNGYSYTCGRRIEALIPDKHYKIGHWVWTRVEHNGIDYYLTNYENIPLNGLLVRVREA